MGAAVEPGTSGKKTISVGYLADVLIRTARGSDCPCAAVLPEINIMLCVESDNPLAGGSGGRLDPDTFLQRLAQQAVRVRFPEVCLGQKRKLPDVINRMNIVRRYALRLHFLPVIGHMIPYMLHLLQKLFILNLTHFLR